MGIRHGFGLWLQPITMDRGWSRETFAFALAVQNLAWGIAGPARRRAGRSLRRLPRHRRRQRALRARPGRHGAGDDGAAFIGGAGLLIGFAQSGTTYAVIYGVIGRNVAPERRSWAMGVAAAAGSFGQFLMVPVEGGLIGALGWQNALLVLGRGRAGDDRRWPSACASRRAAAATAAGAQSIPGSDRARRSATAASSC